MGPLKNYARTQKHDLRTNRTHENALTNSPRSQPSISLEDHAAMDVAPATTKDNNTGSNDTLGLNFNTDTIGNSTEETSLKMVIDAPLSPNSQQLLDSIKSTINQDSFGSIEASDYVLDFEETSLEFFTGSENPQDEGNSTSQDEGYCTSGSTSGKSSPTGSFGEDQPAANMEILQTENGLNETNASATVPEEIIHNGDIFIQEANINPSLEDLSSCRHVCQQQHGKPYGDERGSESGCRGPPDTGPWSDHEGLDQHSVCRCGRRLDSCRCCRSRVHSDRNL